MPRLPVEITFTARCRAPDGAERAMKQAAEAALASVPRGLWSVRGAKPLLHLSLVSGSEMRRLNRDFRKRDKVTDVLSFSRLEGIPVPHPELGDIVVCGAQARRQAKEWDNSLLDELRRLTVHGVLHLLGYDHERSKKDAKIMFELEARILKVKLPFSRRSY